MIGATVCSGIGAPELAMPWIDWALAAETDGFPRAVLAARFGAEDARRRRTGPGATLWGDFTALKPRHFARLNIPLPEVIVAGTPCQAFSVAGLRGGLADARGNLTLAFVRFIDAIDNLRRHRGLAGLVGIWENVPGVFSLGDNPFGCLLAGLAGCPAALVPPRRSGWTDAGVVVGPRRALAWRSLDAQYFGVAQRRKRVFVVFGPRDWPVARVLFPDGQGVRRDSAPGREARPDTAGSLAGVSPGGGWRLGSDEAAAGHVIAAALGAAHGGPDDVAAQANHLVTARTLNAHGGAGRSDADTETFVVAGTLPNIGRAAGSATQQDAQAGLLVVAGTLGAEMARNRGLGNHNETGMVVAHSLTAEGFDASEDGTGRGPPLVPLAVARRARQDSFTAQAVTPPLDTDGFTTAVAIAENQRGELRTADIVTSINAEGGKPGQDYPAIAYQCHGSNVGAMGTLRQGNGNPTGGVPFVMNLRGRDGGSQAECDDRASLRAASGGSSRSYVAHMAVRRLTPRECERLQGFPDDFTMIEWRGKPAPDGPRYRALGNAMAVPVMRWLGDQLKAQIDG